MGRACEHCGAPIGPTRRAQIKTCSTRCRVALHRQRAATGVPAEMRALERWVTWRPVRRGGRVTKMPIQLSGVAASSTDPETWTTYARVRNRDRKGFVLAGDGIACLDLDHCLTERGLEPWAAEIVARAGVTYVEVSASGTGLHVFGLARVDAGRRIRDHRAVEVYGRGRYIAITGNRWRGASSRLADISEVVDMLT